MSGKNAQIINMSELLSDQIGGEDVKKEKKEVAEKDLKNSLEGKEDTFSFGMDKKKETSIEKKEDSDDVPPTSVFKDLEKSEKKEVKAETTAEVPEILTKNTQSDLYRDILKDMYGESISHLIQEDENGEEVEVALEDLDIDKELYLQIVNSKTEEIKSEASKGKISSEGISNFTKDLIEIDKNGGDISKLLYAKESISDPLDNLDITTVEGQKEAVFIRMKAGGQDEDTINRLIRSYESEGILEEYAVKAEGELRSAIKNQIEEEKRQAENLKNQRAEALKNYKKELKTNLSEFELKDSIKNKIVLLATKQDEEGRFEMDRLYREFRENPEKSAKLALFLLDEQEFIDQVTNKAVQKQKLKTASKLKITSKKGSDVGPDFKEKTSSGNKGFIPLSSLV